MRPVIIALSLLLASQSLAEELPFLGYWGMHEGFVEKQIREMRAEIEKQKGAGPSAAMIESMLKRHRERGLNTVVEVKPGQLNLVDMGMELPFKMESSGGSEWVLAVGEPPQKMVFVLRKGYLVIRQADGTVKSVMRRFKNDAERNAKMAKIKAVKKQRMEGPPPPGDDADVNAKMDWVTRTTPERAEAHLEANPDWLKLTDRFKHTLLHRAATRKPELIEYLLKKGLDPKAPDHVGDTPLTHYFRRGEDLEIVRKFVDAGVDPFLKAERGKRPILEAGNRKSKALLDYLFSLKESIPPELALELLKERFGRKKDSILPAYLVEQGYLDGVGEDVKKWQWLPVHHAVTMGDVSLFKALEKRGMTYDLPDGSRRSLVQIAVDSRKMDMLKYLIEKGHDINAQPGYGKITPLMAAVRGAWVEGVEGLLAAGADRTLKDKDGKTAVLYAQTSRESAKLLPLFGAKAMTEFPAGADARVEIRLGKPVGEIKGYTWAKVGGELHQEVTAETKAKVKVLLPNGTVYEETLTAIKLNQKEGLTKLFAASTRSFPTHKELIDSFIEKMKTMKILTPEHQAKLDEFKAKESPNYHHISDRSAKAPFMWQFMLLRSPKDGWKYQMDLWVR